jgi:hypothetical protein
MKSAILDWVDSVYRHVVEVFDVADNRTRLSYFHTLQPFLTTCPECMAKSRRMLPLLQQSMRHLRSMDHDHPSIHTVIMMLIHAMKTLVHATKAESSRRPGKTKTHTRLVVVGSKNHCLIHIPVTRVRARDHDAGVAS